MAGGAFGGAGCSGAGHQAASRAFMDLGIAAIGAADIKTIEDIDRPAIRAAQAGSVADVEDLVHGHCGPQGYDSRQRDPAPVIHGHDAGVGVARVSAAKDGFVDIGNVARHGCTAILTRPVRRVVDGDDADGHDDRHGDDDDDHDDDADDHGDSDGDNDGGDDGRQSLVTCAKELAQARLEHDFGGRLASGVKPVLEILNSYSVGNFGLANPDDDGG